MFRLCPVVLYVLTVYTGIDGYMRVLTDNWRTNNHITTNSVTSVITTYLYK